MTSAPTASSDPHDQVRAEAQAFLAPYPRKGPQRQVLVWGEGDDHDVAIWDDPDPEVEGQELAVAREYRAARFAAGLGWLDGPEAQGGRGLPTAAQRLYDQIEREHAVPSQSFFKLDRVLGLVLTAHASPAAADGLVRGLFSGAVIGCELFSEPGAGSDLAAVGTKAIPVGSGWMISGQKVWTSDAHYADIGLALCRTEPGVAGSKGLTAFLVDMHAPGVEVRPLRQMTGGSSFNEVFLSDVRVPDSMRVGARGAGWAIVQETLRIERSAIGVGLGRGGAGVANGQRLAALVRHLGLHDDPVVRQELAKVYASFRTAKHLQTVSAARHRAGDPGTVSPMLAKLALSRNLRLASHFLMDVLGPRLAADTGEWGTFAWNDFILGEPGMHIMAGTDEVIRTMIGEQALGLPREPRAQQTAATERKA